MRQNLVLGASHLMHRKEVLLEWLAKKEKSSGKPKGEEETKKAETR